MEEDKNRLDDGIVDRDKAKVGIAKQREKEKGCFIQSIAFLKIS